MRVYDLGEKLSEPRAENPSVTAALFLIKVLRFDFDMVGRVYGLIAGS
jgi:hypothetical protein